MNRHSARTTEPCQLVSQTTFSSPKKHRTVCRTPALLFWQRRNLPGNFRHHKKHLLRDLKTAFVVRVRFCQSVVGNLRIFVMQLKSRVRSLHDRTLLVCAGTTHHCCKVAGWITGFRINIGKCAKAWLRFRILNQVDGVVSCSRSDDRQPRSSHCANSSDIARCCFGPA